MHSVFYCELNFEIFDHMIWHACLIYTVPEYKYYMYNLDFELLEVGCL